MNIGGIDRIKHAIRPQVIYEYAPDIDQDDFPSFDVTDRIPEENLLTYSLTTTLIARSLEKKRKTRQQATEAQTTDYPSYRYHQFLRLKLEQSYDIKKKLDDDPEPFSLLEGRLDFVPVKYISLEADSKWSPYDRSFVERNIAVTFRDDRGDKLLVEHRFTEDENESIYVDGHVKLTDRITAYGDYERNLLDDIRLRTSVGFRYTSQCWAVDMRYVDEVSDRRFEFAINLVGLGAFRSAFGGRSIGNPYGDL